jgi:hypothetical protein
MSEHTFHLEVLEGRGFGPDPQALLCTGKFNNTLKTTAYSIGTDAHAWQSSLMWHLTADQLRKLHSSGAVNCKLTVLRKDGTRLGWAVLDLRAAKLASHYQADPEGEAPEAAAAEADHQCQINLQLRMLLRHVSAESATWTWQHC